MEITVVLVGIEYPINLGMISRLLMNFGVKDLILVNPETSPKKPEALKFAKHSRKILESCRTVKSLEELREEFDQFVGTTGVLSRHRNSYRTYYTLRKFAEKLPDGRIALLFGREGIGLTEKEIDFCDFLVNIPTRKEYPSLNLANAVGIVLYELSRICPKKTKMINPGERDLLYSTFDELTEHFRKKKMVRNPKKVKLAFKRIISMTMLPEKETKSVLLVLRRALKELKENSKKQKD